MRVVSYCAPHVLHSYLGGQISEQFLGLKDEAQRSLALLEREVRLSAPHEHAEHVALSLLGEGLVALGKVGSQARCVLLRLIEGVARPVVLGEL